MYHESLRYLCIDPERLTHGVQSAARWRTSSCRRSRPGTRASASRAGASRACASGACYEFQGDVDGRNAAAFVAGLLDTPGVRAWLNAAAPADAAVEATRLATTATSMALFDPLVECATIALPTGGARQCPEVRLGGVAVDDELRKWLLVTAGFGADDDDVDPVECAAADVPATSSSRSFAARRRR
ncbi:DUF4498-like protein [Aureococcus anophagefferens]|nr:DUF4498-like protein [Aureococcus anophagefferens]